jgi:hypothetical protein
MSTKSPPPYFQDRYRLTQWLGEGSMGVVYVELATLHNSGHYLGTRFFG